MKNSTLFLTTILLAFLSLAVASTFKINPKTRAFIDQYGRSRIFHGVNAVYKLPPHHPPILDRFDAFLSLSDEDFKNLNTWGLNFIRLYLSWEGTEKVRGQYNTTYLDIVRNVVRKAAKYNITILLDTHQDLGSRKFCGEGLPDWAVNRTNFPSPLPYHIGFDDKGYANLTDCMKREFALYYTTNDVRNAFKNFYTNVDGIADSFVNFWKTVASYFKDEPNVLGYELINEPVSVSAEKISVDLVYLQPLYKKAHDKIREVDNKTIIFFEPDIFDIYGVGFTQGPGGDAYNDRQAFSYHIYCPDVDHTGEPITPAVCEALDASMLSVKADWAHKHNMAAFLTEFGALSAAPKSVDEISRVTGLADFYLHSWSYWQFKWYEDFTTAARPGSTESFYYPNGTLQEPKVKALSRSYAYATCGTPLAQKFDHKTGNFTYSYYYKKNCQGKGTEIFLNENFYYPKGVHAQFTGCNCTLVGGNNYYSIQVPTTVAEDTVITLKVANAPKSTLDEIIIV